MSTTRAGQRWRLLLAVAAITLLGFVLRLIDLEGRSLWLDEGFSLLRFEQSWEALVSGKFERQGIPTRDLHPPLYFALVRLWSLLAGSNVFTWRLFSAFCSVLVIPLTWCAAYRFIRDVFAAGFAAVLAAVAPAFLWQAAEVRMYALVTVWGVAG
ncbi:MAG: hypothetical protein RMJ86_10960, partial [Anaerolineae bacterium]|nr:hypothetical protein [Anaerolineae bacterium]